jgi:hypothetical protein
MTTASVAKAILTSKPLRFNGSPLAALPETLVKELASLGADESALRPIAPL